MSYKKSQLNAISRSATKLDNAKAREWIVNNYGVTYEQYVAAYGFKGSACCLRSHLESLYGSVGGQLS